VSTSHAVTDTDTVSAGFGPLVGDYRGSDTTRAPLVLLHGLTMDRRVWTPVLEQLSTIDPSRRVLTLDLPAHGQSPEARSYHLGDVVDSIHRALLAAGLTEPVLVGHSISGVLATLYAARLPARGVVNVDQPLDVAPFAAAVRGMADRLRGPGYDATFAAGWDTELLSLPARHLLAGTVRPRQEVVLGYWDEVLTGPADAPATLVSSTLAALRSNRTPYDLVSGSELDPAYRAWLCKSLPQARVVEWPGTGHFPFLGRPREFAALLAAVS
jgi:pimeloyl-ACP methyl ester carboxylesterase